MIARKLRKASANARAYLRLRAVDVGVLPGCTDYVRFLLLGRTRVGSNFLRGLLNSHSQVVAFAEVFRSIDRIQWDVPGFLDTKRLRALRRADPVRFLRQEVFRRFPQGTAAVGLKLAYHQSYAAHGDVVWETLQAQPDLRVIHLKRKNTLRAHLSMKRLLQTGRAVDVTGNGQDDFPIHLDYEQCLEDFNYTRAQEAHYDAFFARQPGLEVQYEDLTRDYPGTVARVYEFLGVDYEPPQPATYKQAHLPLSLAISNYAALKAAFRGSAWEAFFED